MDYGAHLKSENVSHNAKSRTYVKQSPYEGSLRQLRASVLFAIANRKELPQDERIGHVLDLLIAEGYVVRKGRGYAIA
jgi:A/G-specific adenine glycosylase